MCQELVSNWRRKAKTMTKAEFYNDLRRGLSSKQMWEPTGYFPNTARRVADELELEGRVSRQLMNVNALPHPPTRADALIALRDPDANPND